MRISYRFVSIGQFLLSCACPTLPHPLQRLALEFFAFASAFSFPTFILLPSLDSVHNNYDHNCHPCSPKLALLEPIIWLFFTPFVLQPTIKLIFSSALPKASIKTFFASALERTLSTTSKQHWINLLRPKRYDLSNYLRATIIYDYLKFCPSHQNVFIRQFFKIMIFVQISKMCLHGIPELSNFLHVHEAKSKPFS